MLCRTKTKRSVDDSRPNKCSRCCVEIKLVAAAALNILLLPLPTLVGVQHEGELESECIHLLVLVSFVPLFFWLSWPATEVRCARACVR
jgi:hypothetical protein